MKKLVAAVAGAFAVLLAAGCTGSGNPGKDHSLQSKIASMQRQLVSDQRHISDLQHDLSRERDILEASRTDQAKAIQELEGRLKREQPGG